MQLASPHLRLVLSTSAWVEYHVPAHPYFVYIEWESGHILGEGAARSWSQVISMLTDALADSGRERRVTPIEVQSGPAWQEANVDRALRSAGIGPDDQSLYDA